MNRLLAAVLLIALACSASSQDSKTTYPDRLNVVKVGLTSGLVQSLSLNYERVLDTKWSVALNVSYMFPGKPAKFLKFDPEKVTFESDRRLSGWFITPEVRWYLETKDPRPAPRGFYLGAYGRASNLRFTASLSASGTETEGNVDGSLRVDLSEYGFGIQAGYQLFMIKDRMVLDFLFFGPRLSYYELRVQAEVDGQGELAADIQQALQEALGRDILPIDVDVSTQGTSNSGLFSAGYRFGFKIGYAF